MAPHTGRTGGERRTSHAPGHHPSHRSGAPSPAVRRRTVRVSGRDIDGLMLCGEMYGAPYDLLAGGLNVQPDRLRGIVARWRAAGYAETGQLGPGPAWCWLTRPGLAALGLRFARPPVAGTAAHLRAVLAARLALNQPRRAGRAALVALRTPYPRRGRRAGWGRAYP